MMIMGLFAMDGKQPFDVIALHGLVRDKYGKKMFDKAILTAEGEVPKVFRMNLLKSDSTSSLSELMREIEKN